MVIAANKSIIVQKGADSQPEEHLFSLRKRIEKILSGGTMNKRSLRKILSSERNNTCCM